MEDWGQDDIRARLIRIERKIGAIGYVVNVAASGGVAWIVYTTAPGDWGISKGTAGWIAFCVFLVAGYLFNREFDKG